MLASCVLVTMALYQVVPNVVALLGVMLFVFFFEIGLGAFCFCVMFFEAVVFSSMLVVLLRLLLLLLAVSCFGYY
jgi:hypothetical protein